MENQENTSNAELPAESLASLLDEIENKIPEGGGRIAWLNPTCDSRVEALVEIYNSRSNADSEIGLNEILGKLDGSEWLTINEDYDGWLAFLADARKDMRRLISAVRKHLRRNEN